MNYELRIRNYELVRDNFELWVLRGELRNSDAKELKGQT